MGIAGDLRGNELAIDTYLPIFSLDFGSEKQKRFIARRPNWRLGTPTTLELVDESELEKFGTRLSPDSAALDLTINEGDSVTVLGPAYAEIAQELAQLDFTEWSRLENGLLMRCDHEEVARQLTAVLDRPAEVTFWTELRHAELDADLRETHDSRVAALLAFLGSSFTYDRISYYAASLAYHRHVARDGVEKSNRERRLERLLQVELKEQSFERVANRAAELSHSANSDSDAGTERSIGLADLRRHSASETFLSSLREFSESSTQSLRESAEFQSPLLIDLGGNEERSDSPAYRLETMKLLVLSNLLQARFRPHTDIIWRAPRTSGIANQIARGGLTAQLALSSTEADLVRNLWVDPVQSLRSTGKENLSAARLFVSRRDLAFPRHKNLLTFLNPHHRTWNEDYVVETTRVIENWLTARLTSLAQRRISPHPPPESQEFIGAAVAVVIQLLANVRLHARLSRTPLRDAAGDYSLVQMFTTHGGGSRSGNRLYICVADTGVGISASILDRHPHSSGRGSSERLTGGLDGEYRSESGSQGIGLSEVRNMAKRLDNSDGASVVPRLVIMTTDDESPGSCLVFADRPTTKEGHAIEQWKVPIQGTIALVTLPISASGISEPPANESAEQLEFAMGLD